MAETEWIILEETDGGRIEIPVRDLTPEFLAELKADKDDKKGWKKYRKVMKDKGYDIGDADDE